MTDPVKTTTKGVMAGCAPLSCCVSLPVPFYDAGGITIYHGDSRLIMPMLGRFDLLMADPPYGIGENSKQQKTRGIKANAKWSWPRRNIYGSCKKARLPTYHESKATG